MDHIGELADRLRSPSAPLRVVSGVAVAVPDASHVLVSVGDRAVTAWSPGSVSVGDDVRLLVGGNVCEVISSRSPFRTVPFAVASGTSMGVAATTTDNINIPITYPAGRFTSPPTLIANVIRYSGMTGYQVGAVFPSNLPDVGGGHVNVNRAAGATSFAPGSSITISWIAVQMDKA